jgi:hypothetical protein
VCHAFSLSLIEIERMEERDEKRKRASESHLSSSSSSPLAGAVSFHAPLLPHSLSIYSSDFVHLAIRAVSLPVSAVVEG